ncbi:hypothetical protein BGZ73_000465 [Actinomortierella ambigua]|nr:hypothetical protein BGZ73_000465 [Actinomortierella ambigua]
MHSSSALFTTLFLALLVFVQAVVAKVPPAGNYRILSQNRPVRAAVPGAPLQVSSGVGVPSSSVWELTYRSDTVVLKAGGTSNYARVAGNAVTVGSSPSPFRLRQIGSDTFEIWHALGVQGTQLWTATNTTRSTVALVRRNGSVLQRFRFVRA